MSSNTLEIDRIAPTCRPPGRAIGYHRWRNLLFIHWRMPPELVTGLLPAELTLDTWYGDAWVGLVPFHMTGVRPSWWPWGFTFHETNVRTYVHFQGHGPGVWFFSLEAANRLAVWVARQHWHLNYHFARMEVLRAGDQVQYTSRRLWPGKPGAVARIVAEVGPLLGAGQTERSLAAGLAEPCTLEHFLIERYLLYAQAPGGPLRRGQVHHAPYVVRTAQLLQCEETLLAAVGIKPATAPCHVAFCDGVDVEVFRLVPVEPSVW
ncbi:MAG TPA: DUF2071 domain-containing protein [Pirellulales bacterium]|nr:DUF2071 domain-containing protein [Pirellulales bacterium]